MTPIDYREFSASFPSLREESFSRTDANHKQRRFGIDFNDTSSSAEAQLYRVDASLGQPVHTDIAGGGVPLVDAFTVIYGTTRPATLGSDVVVNLTTTHTVGFSIEGSDDGSTWLGLVHDFSSDFDVLGGQSAGFRFTPSQAFYRVRVITDNLASVSSIWALSQVRPTGI